MEEANKRRIDQAAIQLLAEDIFEHVIRKIQKEAASEMATVNLMAKQIALNIIVSSIKNERNTTNTIDKLNKMFYGERQDNM